MTPSPTATVTPLPKSKPTVTPVAEALLSVDGPWVLVIAADGVWAANEDGSGLTQITQDVALHRTVSVSGRWVAYVADEDAEGLVLRVLSLPDGLPATVTGLDIRDVTESSSEDLQYAAEQVIRAIEWENGGPVWSPDGTRVAFASGHAGTSGDLYAYVSDTGVTTRLSEVPGHAYQINWSPDGTYVFHTSASNFGSGAGYAMEGVWVSRADASGTRSLYTPDTRTGAEEFVAWESDDTLLVNSWRPDCGANTLRRINVATGEVVVLWPDYVRRVVYNPETGASVLDVPEISCNPEGIVGFYMLEAGAPGFEQVSEAAFQSQLPEPPLDPVPEALKEELGALLEVDRVIWVQP